MKYLFGLVLLIILFSCKGNQKAIVGRWKLERIDYTEHFKSVPEEVRQMLTNKMDEEFERLKGKTFFVFKDNGVLELESPNFIGNIITVNGKYHFNDQEDSLFFDIENPESYKILTLESGKLTIRTDELPKRTLYLTKSK